MRRQTSTVTVALLALALSAAPLQAGSDAQVRKVGAVAYVSGGVTEEAREALNAQTKDFNLKLILATRSGAFLSDVDVAVNDARGQKILVAKADGPWFYAKLPVGRYEIAASSNGKTVHKQVTISGQHQSRVDLRWDD